MELFTRRYLCFISFAFVLTALLITSFVPIAKVALGIASGIAIILCAVLCIKIKKRRFEFFFALLISFAVSVSAFSSYLVVTRAQQEALSLVGNNTVMVKIVSKSGENKYDVRLLRVGDEDFNIKSTLIFEDKDDLGYGDRLIMNADIYLSRDKKDISKLIALYPSDKGEMYFSDAKNENYFSIDGVSALCHSLQEKFAEHTDKVFGDHGAYAKALLVNDTSDIDARTDTDFKRSGTSHILAVSGMHIALLMGALEIFLRTLSVKKGIRIVVISITAIFFLALTAFVASAVRSVIMLFAVYLCYILYEENDSVTALFTSIAIIILFSPFSVYDLGMWMSFLATLGILTVYPIIDERMPYPKQKNLLIRYMLRLLVWIVKAISLTVIANFFLLPIMWYVFGSVSISSIPCNLILGPIVTVLMPLCAVADLLGFIPYVSIPFAFVANKLIDVMMSIVRYFSEVRFGVLSLKYEFASILVIIFSVVMLIMLVIRLKHKLVALLPMVAFVVAFAVCFSVFNNTSKPQVQCLKVRDVELMFVNKGAECSVFDVGGGDFIKSDLVETHMSKYATEIDEYFLLNPTKQDLRMIDRVSKNTIIRKLYISKSVENEGLSLYSDIIKCAEKYNISIELYDEETSVEIYNGVMFSYNEEQGFSLSSNSVLIKKTAGELVAEYNGVAHRITCEDSISSAIPLN